MFLPVNLSHLTRVNRDRYISYEKGVGVLPQNRFGNHISCLREYFDHLISGHSP